MTEPLTFTLWLLLAVIQQHGSVAFTAGTQAACLEARAKLTIAAETVALSNCIPVELVRYQDGAPVQVPKVAP